MAESNEVIELKERVEQLEKEKMEIAGLYVNTLIQNVKLMDTYIPDWRIEAKESIDTLTSILKGGKP